MLSPFRVGVVRGTLYEPSLTLYEPDKLFESRWFAMVIEGLELPYVRFFTCFKQNNEKIIRLAKK